MGSFCELRKFVAPEVVYGVGSRFMAGRYCKNLNASKVLVVTDEGVIKNGWVHDVLKSLEEECIDYHIYKDVSPNPRTFEVMAGKDVYIDEKCDVILAVGGGSPMDCAKGIGIVVSNGGNILDYEGVDKIFNPVPPFIFVPTTAGTSADVSQFAIISNRVELIKMAIISKSLVPDVALVDPETTVTMDRYLTACTGIDALVHAIEAFVSTASSRITDIHAIESIKLIHENLKAVIDNPSNLDLRGKIMFASMEAGFAFSNAILGAVHAMAHSLGGLLDLPHGECNALLLDSVVDFNFISETDKFGVIAECFGIDIKCLNEVEIKKSILNSITDLKKSVGIENTLSKVGVSFSDISLLAEKAMNDPCMITNPRVPDKRDIEVIYERAL